MIHFGSNLGKPAAVRLKIHEWCTVHMYIHIYVEPTIIS